jgi:NAD(P)-dependent dehydrogenase (short-subunit alcohol dehydrogenase family)
MTRRFVEEGAKVVGGDITETGLEQLQGIPNTTPLQANVTSQTDIDKLVETAQSLGSLDIVCNNAGVVDRFMPVDEVTDEVWEHVFAVNLTGPMLLCRAAVPIMRKAGHGVIINISSAAGLRGAAAGAAYTSSKHGLIGLTKHIAATYVSDGIRCVAIAPGGVNTNLSLGGAPSQLGYATLQKILAFNPRVGEAVEIASVAVFLASDEASFINGAIIPVDAGWATF